MEVFVLISGSRIKTGAAVVSFACRLIGGVMLIVFAAVHVPSGKIMTAVLGAVMGICALSVFTERKRDVRIPLLISDWLFAILVSIAFVVMARASLAGWIPLVVLVVLVAGAVCADMYGYGASVVMPLAVIGTAAGLYAGVAVLLSAPAVSLLMVGVVAVLAVAHLIAAMYRLASGG
jgi:hypothetical protein